MSKGCPWAIRPCRANYGQSERPSMLGGAAAHVAMGGGMGPTTSPSTYLHCMAYGPHAMFGEFTSLCLLLQ